MNPIAGFWTVSQAISQARRLRIDEADGPPPGIPATGLRLLFDEAQGTAVVIQLFDSAEDMRIGGEAFAAMDPGETPGTRVSVDMCETKLERHM